MCGVVNDNQYARSIYISHASVVTVGECIIVMYYGISYHKGRGHYESITGRCMYAWHSERYSTQFSCLFCGNSGGVL